MAAHVIWATIDDNSPIMSISVAACRLQFHAVRGRSLRASPGSFGECVKSPAVRVGEKSFWQARFFPKVSSPDSRLAIEMQTVFSTMGACFKVLGTFTCVSENSI